MSDKGPKSKNDKAKFFKIDRDDTSSNSPDKDEMPIQADDISQISYMRPEPFFSNEKKPDDSLIDLDLELPEVPESQTDSERDEQIGKLRPQVEDISSSKQGGSLSADQVNVLKKYIALKEAEVRDFREQHRQYRTFLKKVTTQLEGTSRRSRDLLTELEAVKAREEVLRMELRETKQKHEGDVLLLKNDYEEKLRRSGNYESQVEDLSRKREEWREKLREDLKRIKLKERELENKHELLKRDTQALLDSKDKHVLELKKKNDALELELETLEERLRKANTILNGIESKKKRLVETMRLATSLLETIDNLDAKADENSRDQSDDPDRKAG